MPRERGRQETLARVARLTTPQRARRTTPHWALGGLMAVVVAGCASVFGTTTPERGRTPCCTTTTGGLELQYLGTGGWWMGYGGVEIATGPFFSNPPAYRSLVAPIGPDTAAIDGALAQLNSLANVEAVLVGHAHYDHLLDVPYLLTDKAPHATAYGSRTTAHILAAVPGLDPGRIVSVEDSVASDGDPPRWIVLPGGRVRFMPLESDHAPHFQGIELYEGSADSPRRELPRTAGAWVGGTTLGFLIDFLDTSGDVVFRVHYVDSATRWPLASPHPLPDGRRVDVLILCAPSYAEVEGYPEGLVWAGNPRYALVGHWEDFFTPWSLTPARSVAGSNLDGFTTRLTRAMGSDTTWTLPNPGDRVRIPKATP